MSFAAEVKDELSRIHDDNLVARKAELAALIRIEGKLSGKYRLEMTTETAPVARATVSLLHDVYHLKTEITTRRNVLHKNYNYLITVPSQPDLVPSLKDLGILSARGLELGINPDLVATPQGLAAFLRGAFMAGGFISNPRQDFHFELNVGHEALANGLVALLMVTDIQARTVERRDSWVVYLKGAEQIVDFLALVGAHRAVLAIENVRVTKSIRNDENRRVNAEIANQTKTIEASLEQVRNIQLLIDRCGLDSLPPALRELAALRLAHPDVSLRELGELAKPPLTKSAVYHRVRRIEAIAKDYLESEDL
jgi:DNA-binding protein WhiA